MTNGDNVNQRSWPPVTYEERTLEGAESSPIDDYTGRRKRYRSDQPYLASVTPQIAKLERLDIPTWLSAEAAEAAAEIARFDAEMSGEFANFGSILLRSESASSSEIENLTAHAKAIVLAGIGDTRVGKNASLIYANSRAMDRAIELADAISEDSIISMHAALVASSHPEWTGHWRTDQVRIGGFSVHDAQFVPPHHSRVPGAMTDLVQFIGRTDLPTFEHAAIAHAQFETIHPFPDGNGRVGRALLHAMFKHAGLTRNVTVPVSAGLLADPSQYFEALTQYRLGDVTSIIQLFTQATLVALGNGRLLAAELKEINDEWRGAVKTRSGSTIEKMLTYLLRQPAIDSPMVQATFQVSRQSADTAIFRLVEGGVLEPASTSRRNRRWVAPDVLAALDRFAARSRRRKIT